MSIGIVGLGFVGQAIAQFFKERSRIDLKMYDKYKANGIGQPKDILETSIVFLCLPTPYDKYLQTYDLTALHEVCSYLYDHLYDGLVVIKSTVLPTTCQDLANKYNLPIIHNPEFLTARTAKKDFASQSHIVLGYTIQGEIYIERLKTLYNTYFPEAEISITVSEQSEAMKVFCNSFYATKVQIFNEFYMLCQKLGLNYDDTRDLMLKNKWINPMHTNVPGPDGKLSFGGMCFIKDLQAIIGQMNLYETPCAVLSASIKERDEMRRD